MKLHIVLLVIMTTSLVGSLLPGTNTSAYSSTDPSTANSPTDPSTADSLNVPITANSATVQSTAPFTTNSATVQSTANSPIDESTADSSIDESTADSSIDEFTTIDFPSQEFGGGFVGQTSMDFTTNRSLDLKAPIQKLLLNAQTYSLNVSLHGSCNETIKWRIGKCGIAFFREKSNVQNFTILWTAEPIVFLLNATKEECFGNFFSDGTVHFVVEAEASTNCTFIFTLSGEETDTSHWSRIKTADPRFFFFSPVSHKSKSNIWLYVFIGAAAIVVFMGTMVMGHCMNSDGLGDDVASDIVMGPGEAFSQGNNGSGSGFELEYVISGQDSDKSIRSTDDE